MSLPALNRRIFFKSSLAVGAAAVVCNFSSPAHASKGQVSVPVKSSKNFDEWYSLLDFVPENASIEEIEKIFPETPGSGAHRAYRNFVTRHGAGYNSRGQVALYLTRMTDIEPGHSAQALPLIVVHVARILLQAAIRTGGALYSTLRLIIKGGVYYGKRGYAAFNLFLQHNPFLGGIIVGVSSNHVYAWLVQNMP